MARAQKPLTAISHEAVETFQEVGRRAHFLMASPRADSRSDLTYCMQAGKLTVRKCQNYFFTPFYSETHEESAFICNQNNR